MLHLKSKLVLALVLGMLLPTSCKKDENAVKRGEQTEVSGRIVQQGTGKTVTYPEVWLVQTGGFTAWENKALEMAPLDSLGRFSFKFTPEENKAYEIFAKRKYYNDIHFYIPKDQHSKNIKVGMIPFGYLRVNIKNINKKAIELLSVTTGVGSFTRGQFSMDTSFIATSTGNESWPVIIQRQYEGKPLVQTMDSIYVPALDTTDYYINY